MPGQRRPCGHESSVTDCRLCRLWDHDQRWRALRGGAPPAAAVPAASGNPARPARPAKPRLSLAELAAARKK